MARFDGSQTSMVASEELFWPTLAWTPDGRSVIVEKASGEQCELWQFPIDGGTARKLDIDVNNWEHGIGTRLSPDGKQIAFVARAGKEEDPRSGHLRISCPKRLQDSDPVFSGAAESRSCRLRFLCARPHQHRSESSDTES